MVGTAISGDCTFRYRGSAPFPRGDTRRSHTVVRASPLPVRQCYQRTLHSPGDPYHHIRCCVSQVTTLYKHYIRRLTAASGTGISGGRTQMSGDQADGWTAQSSPQEPLYGYGQICKRVTYCRPMMESDYYFCFRMTFGAGHRSCLGWRFACVIFC